MSLDLRKRLRSATESADWSIFHNAPFLKHLRRTLSKVDLTFLKGHTPPTQLDSSGREQDPAPAG
jgi:hypothetical protein